MEIDWFWLAVICGIVSFTIVVSINNYLEYKTTKIVNKKPEEEDNNNDGA